MPLCATLYHAFMPILYAATLYRTLCQLYARRTPLGFVPLSSLWCYLVPSDSLWPPAPVLSGYLLLQAPSWLSRAKRRRAEVGEGGGRGTPA